MVKTDNVVQIKHARGLNDVQKEVSAHLGDLVRRVSNHRGLLLNFMQGIDQVTCRNCGTTYHKGGDNMLDQRTLYCVACDNALSIFEGSTMGTLYSLAYLYSKLYKTDITPLFTRWTGISLTSYYLSGCFDRPVKIDYKKTRINGVSLIKEAPDLLKHALCTIMALRLLARSDTCDSLLVDEYIKGIHRKLEISFLDSPTVWGTVWRKSE